MILKPHNLFLLLAVLCGILAFVFGFLVSPSESMPERPHLAFIFTCILGVMGAISLIYWVMEKLDRPVSPKIGIAHYLIALLAVGCGVICTATAYDGVENPAWTRVASFFSLKLFMLSMGVFLFGVIRALIVPKFRVEMK